MTARVLAEKFGEPRLVLAHFATDSRQTPVPAEQ